MHAWIYRLVVVGSMLSSFLVGLHVPMLHDILEHGATPRWDVMAVTLLLAVGAAAGTWRLLRGSLPLRDRVGH
jgi:hypothetical protein